MKVDIGSMILCYFILCWFCFVFLNDKDGQLIKSKEHIFHWRVSLSHIVGTIQTNTKMVLSGFF